ncbi:MAG: hypothetical protein WD740_01750 [Anaerolineales bacterium]
MTDLFFSNIDEAPVPPGEVRIRELAAEPRRDRARIDVSFALTPFQKRPNLELLICDEAGREMAALSVVEAIDPKMDFTMHLRQAETGGHYTLELLVFYADVEAHATTNGGQPSASEILSKARQVVDRRTIEFEIPAGDTP